MKSIKTLVALLFILLLSSPSWSATLGDLVERDGLYYKQFTEAPFTGKVTGDEQGSIKSGKKEGAWVSYHGNGQLEFKGNYKNGGREGAWVWYHENGQLLSKGNYEDGNRYGFWNDYGEDGTVNKERTGFYKKNGILTRSED